MQLFQIGPMNVSREEFKAELKKNGFPYGYIPNVYEKFKQENLTVFRILIEGCPFVVATDDEKSYPEVSEETGKKIEPYSFEWLVDLEERARLCGPTFHDVLMSELQRYIRVQMEERRELDEEQKNCPYCHNLDGHGPDLFECDNKNADASIELDENVISFDNSDGHYTYGTFKINFCPICRRKLEEKV